jgi:hypothetical protein
LPWGGRRLWRFNSRKGSHCRCWILTARRLDAHRLLLSLFHYRKRRESSTVRLYLQVRHSQRIGKKVKVCRNAMDHVTGDGSLLIREGGDKCVLAEEIDDSRDASG